MGFKAKIFFSLIVGAVLISPFFYFINGYCQGEDLRNVIIVDEKIVRGSSLSPLMESGETIKAYFGYYKYHAISREDIVLVQFAGNKDPLIKIVKGLPEDKFSLQKIDDDKGWHILLNNEILKNSQNVSYMVSGKRYDMLNLYARDNKGIIPEGAYLILGNMPSGSLDSTRFGFIGKSSIIAKVIKE